MQRNIDSYRKNQLSKVLLLASFCTIFSNIWTASSASVTRALKLGYAIKHPGQSTPGQNVPGAAATEFVPQAPAVTSDNNFALEAGNNNSPLPSSLSAPLVWYSIDGSTWLSKTFTDSIVFALSTSSLAKYNYANVILVDAGTQLQHIQFGDSESTTETSFWWGGFTSLNTALKSLSGDDYVALKYNTSNNQVNFTLFTGTFTQQGQQGAGTATPSTTPTPAQQAQQTATPAATTQTPTVTPPTAPTANQQGQQGAAGATPAQQAQQSFSGNIVDHNQNVVSLSGGNYYLYYQLNNGKPADVVQFTQNSPVIIGLSSISTNLNETFPSSSIIPVASTDQFVHAAFADDQLIRKLGGESSLNDNGYWWFSMPKLNTFIPNLTSNNCLVLNYNTTTNVIDVTLVTLPLPTPTATTATQQGQQGAAGTEFVPQNLTQIPLGQDDSHKNLSAFDSKNSTWTSYKDPLSPPYTMTYTVTGDTTNKSISFSDGHYIIFTINSAHQGSNVINVLDTQNTQNGIKLLTSISFSSSNSATRYGWLGMADLNNSLPILKASFSTNTSSSIPQVKYIALTYDNQTASIKLYSGY
jgi:hypothetical protein